MFEGVIYGFVGNKVFDMCNDYKVIGDLGIFFCFDFIVEIFDIILSLDSVSIKKGIFFQIDFIFNDYCRNVVMFQSVYSKDKVFDFVICVFIKNNRFGGIFKDIVQVL